MPTRELHDAVQPADRDVLAHAEDLRTTLIRWVTSKGGSRPLAEDIAHDALCRILERGGGWPPVRDAETYAIGIARHVLSDWFRSRARERRTRERARRVRAQWVSRSAPGPFELVAAAERRRWIGAALGRLDRSDRRLLDLCYRDGLSCAEIARLWDVPAERIRKRKSRALQRLRRLLHESSPTIALASRRSAP